MPLSAQKDGYEFRRHRAVAYLFTIIRQHQAKCPCGDVELRLADIFIADSLLSTRFPAQLARYC